MPLNRAAVFLVSLVSGCSTFGSADGTEGSGVDGGLPPSMQGDSDARADVSAEGSRAGDGVYAMAVLADGPATYLRLEESRSDPDAIDAVTGRAIGKYVGNAQRGAPGAMPGSNGVLFAGSPGEPGEIDMGDVFNFDGASAAFTFELWVRIDEFRNSGALFSKDDSASTPRQGYNLHAYKNGLQWW